MCRVQCAEYTVSKLKAQSYTHRFSALASDSDGDDNEEVHSYSSKENPNKLSLTLFISFSRILWETIKYKMSSSEDCD